MSVCIITNYSVMQKDRFAIFRVKGIMMAHMIKNKSKFVLCYIFRTAYPFATKRFSLMVQFYEAPTM